MSAAFCVRPVTAEDLAGLLGLYAELGEGSPGPEPVSLAQAQRLLREVQAQEGRALLVATVDGSLAGTADLCVVPGFTHGGRPWAVVEHVVVSERFRRRGVGRALMQAVVERCRSAGCYKVQLASRQHRLGAHEFYRALGFETSALAFRLYLD